MCLILPGAWLCLHPGLIYVLRQPRIYYESHVRIAFARTVVGVQSELKRKSERVTFDPRASLKGNFL